MNKNKEIIACILLLLSANLFSQEAIPNAQFQTPKVYLIGSVHHMHFDTSYNYSINDLLTQVSFLKPDLVCGEITPEAYKNKMEGYFPPEAAFLDEMSGVLNYRFKPVDWRLDFATQTIASNEYPVDVKKQRKELLKKLQEQIDSSKAISLYDTFHDSTFLSGLDSLYEKIIRKSALAEIASGSWTERNRRAVENGIAHANDAKVIVFVFGVDHIPQLKRQLELLGYHPIIPKRVFTPTNNYKVSKAALDRWEQNKLNLELISTKQIPATNDNYSKVINCNRINDLNKAITNSK